MHPAYFKTEAYLTWKVAELSPHQRLCGRALKVTFGEERYHDRLLRDYGSLYPSPRRGGNYHVYFGVPLYLRMNVP